MSNERFSIDLQRNVISDTVLNSLFFRREEYPIVPFKEYIFDSISNNIDDYLDNWIVFDDISNCVSLDNIYIVDCDIIGNDGIYYYVKRYKPLERLYLNSELLFKLRCSYKAHVQFAMLYPNIKRELFEYFERFKEESNMDLLIELLNYVYEPKWLNMLFKTEQDITNIEGLSTLPVKTKEEQGKRLDFIDRVIERQNLMNNDIYTILVNNEINPTLYIDRVTDEDLYFKLATKYSVLRDPLRITDEELSVSWAIKFGNVDAMENNISSSEYAYRFAKYVRKTELCRSKIIESEPAYKWALTFPEDVDNMRSIVLAEADPFICTLFAANIDKIDDSHSLYPTYSSIVLNSSDNKPLYYWATLLSLDLDTVSQQMYDNPNTYENQGWIFQFVSKYPDNRITPSGDDLFDRIDHPRVLFKWALQFPVDVSDCLTKFITYSGSENISDIAYNWIRSIGDHPNIRSFIADEYWRLKTEYILGMHIAW